MSILKIISGGQTGADRGGLDAAIHCKLAHGGWCPKGRIAEDGAIPAQYLLQESTSKNYTHRTEANVVDSDCTLIFTYGTLEGGSLKTAQFAKKHNRPFLHVDLASGLSREKAVDMIVQWLKDSCPKACVLNVAGQRASKAPTIAGVVKAWMVDVINKANGTMFYPIQENAPARMSPFPRSDPNGEELQQLLDALPGHHHPKTIEEAVGIVLAILSKENQALIRAQPREAFAVMQHFGMGMWIRGIMINRNENYIDLMADFQKRQKNGLQKGGRIEPDDVSSVIAMSVWDRLHE